MGTAAAAGAGAGCRPVGIGTAGVGCRENGEGVGRAGAGAGVANDKIFFKNVCYLSINVYCRNFSNAMYFIGKETSFYKSCCRSVPYASRSFYYP